MAATPFPELDRVLSALVHGARDVLGEAFVGAYLQGSFALGDGDAASDADFIIVTAADPGPAEEEALGVLHAAIHDRPEPWAQHLEGSYVPRGVFRRPPSAHPEAPGAPRDRGWRDPATGQPPRAYPFLFLGNGERALVRSEHDNTLVVRQVLREHGITLAGPPPSSLVDAVDPDELRGEIRAIMRSFGDEVVTGSFVLDALWMQGFTALLFARMLHALATGKVGSKPAALAWAREHVDARWLPLLEDAWAQRARYPRGRGAPYAHRTLAPAPERAAETIAFVRYALGRVEG